ncbi:MAG: ornithine cyclodeaminase family protein [Rhodospirillaceae bacterium]|nr:ornithine cyclodeaminase family protein [Rhodospirillaceae bacterium]
MSLDRLPFVGEAEIAAALRWPDLIDALEAAMIAFSAGQVVQPVRQMNPVPGKDAIMAAMPAIGAGSDGAMGVKVVTLFHGNAGTGVPTHQAVILLFDKANGAPLAILDGRLITEMRTAAGTAAIVRRLTSKEPKTVAILGNGVQARAHADALRSIRKIDELRLWARNPARGRPVAEDLGAVFRGDAAEAVQDADIVVCATSATEPVLKGAWVRQGALVASVGWNGADGRELDDAAMAHTVLVESRDAARDQAGDVRGSGCPVFAEVGEVYAGTARVPEGATVIYDSVGIAIQDVAAASLAFDRVTAPAGR